MRSKKYSLTNITFYLFLFPSSPFKVKMGVEINVRRRQSQVGHENRWVSGIAEEKSVCVCGEGGCGQLFSS
jgi:hypothetical protein